MKPKNRSPDGDQKRLGSRKERPMQNRKELSFSFLPLCFCLGAFFPFLTANQLPPFSSGLGC